MTVPSCALIGAGGHALATTAGRVLISADAPTVRADDIDRIADELGADVALRSVSGPSCSVAWREPTGELLVLGAATAIIDTPTSRIEVRPRSGALHRQTSPDDAHAVVLALGTIAPATTDELEHRPLDDPGWRGAGAISVRTVTTTPPTPLGLPGASWGPPTPTAGLEVIDIERRPVAGPAPLPIGRVPAEVAPSTEGNGAGGELTSTVMVRGVRCPVDHHNHPEAGYCSQCGRKMGINATAILVEGPRPPIGLMLVDTGEILPLASPLLIGRDPVSHPDVRGGTRRGLILSDDSQMLSRHHLAVDLDGWNVVATDLGSANGTGLVRATTGGKRSLRPHEPTRLRNGDRLRIGARELLVELHHTRDAAARA